MIDRPYVWMPWTSAGVLLALFLWNGEELYDRFADPSDWYAIVESPEVRRLQDGSWEVCVTTEIRRNFGAQWRATLRLVRPDGTEEPHSAFTYPDVWDYQLKGEAEFCASFEEYTGLPVPQQDGAYRLYFVWPMVTDDGRKRTQRAQSNLFEVS